MKNTIICDIDGTIADVRHRLHYIQNPDGSKKAKPDWAAFHAACVDDPPYKDVLEVVQAMLQTDEDGPAYALHFLSGRSDVVREQTLRWLHRHGFSLAEGHNFRGFQSLTMRKAGDHRPDTEIKLEMVRELGLTPDRVLCIFDDRQCVVDMWRANGYRVLQVAAWKE